MSQFEDFKDIPQVLVDAIRDSFRSWLRISREIWHFLLILFLAIGTFVWFAKPAPPRTVDLAAGQISDYSFKIAKRYVAYFAKNGVELRLIPTQGSIDSLDRLRDRQDSIKAAFIQGGLATNPEDSESLLSLGSIAYEPIWVFYWGDKNQTPDRPLVELLKGTFSIGNVGSGTHAKALQILKVNEIPVNPQLMLELPLDESVEALKTGQIQGMILVENYESPTVQDLLKVKGLMVADFIRARAYAQQLGYIEVLHVPMGAFDLASNYPQHDIQLLSTTTTLVVEKDLHPAIQMLFMQASKAIVGQENFFNGPHEFPSVKDPTLPLSEVAQRYFEKGAPILSYHLPFWLAEFLERLGLLLVPFLAFVYPVMKSIPDFLLKRARKRIERFYVALHKLESEVNTDCDPEFLEGKIEDLNQIERNVLRSKIDKKLVADFYALRSDIEFVRAILSRLKALKTKNT